MAQPYVGEIRMFAGNYAPAGWMMCEGQLLQISEYETLFQLIGTTYGGDGQSTYALPDLRGRVPVHQSGNYILAEMGGAEEVTLAANQLPVHNHSFIGTNAGSIDSSPANAVLGTSTQVKMYHAGAPDQNMAVNLIDSVGGSQPHTNMQPYLCINFIISLFGIFPSPT